MARDDVVAAPCSLGGARADRGRRLGRSLLAWQRWWGLPALADRKGSGASGCPSSNPPNQMTLVAGTPQTAILGTRLCDRLAGRAHQQRWLPRHERRRGDPGHVQRTRRVARAGCSPPAGLTPSSSAPSLGYGRRAAVHRQHRRGQLHRHRQLAVRLGLVLADEHRRGHTGEDRRDPAEEQIGERHEPLSPAAAGQGAGRQAATRSRAPRSRSRSAPAAASACGTSTSSSAGASFTGGGTQATATTGATGVASSPLAHREQRGRVVHRDGRRLGQRTRRRVG